MESDLYTYLAAQVSSVSGRVYPLKRPQGGDLPCLTYFKVSAPRSLTLAAVEDFVQARVQLDVYAASYAEAKTVVDELITAVSGYRGTMGTTKVWSISVENENDSYEDKDPVYRVILQILVTYQEP